jgi:hypothetical protein
MDAGSGGRSREELDNPFEVVVDEHHYIVPYDTKQQLWHILNKLKLHNDHAANPDQCPVEYVRYSDHEPYTPLEPGEELVDAELVTYKARWAPYLSPALGPALSRGVTFRNAGGHQNTYAFLQWHLLTALPNVYMEGFPAITVYQCDAYTTDQIATRKVVPPDRIRGEPFDEFDATPVTYKTRKTYANPAFGELMADLVEGESRAKRMRLNPHVPPYEAAVHAALRPWPTTGGCISPAPDPQVDPGGQVP